MGEAFYSDRAAGPRPRDLSHVQLPTWRGIVALIEQRISSHWLAEMFPDHCQDGNGVCGTNRRNLFDLMEALIPAIGSWPPDRDVVPADEVVFDLIEFVAKRVAEPKRRTWHDYFQHHELGFDATAGQIAFRADINQVLSRTRVAFELDVQNEIVRLGPAESRAIVADLLPDTGDSILDELVVHARVRFLSRSAGEERIGLQQLWDAFERLKTLEPGRDKKASATALLDRAASGEMRSRLEAEAKELTEIGNRMQIRHFELSKASLSDDDVDYLFTRMSALLVQLLRRTGRLSS